MTPDEKEIMELSIKNAMLEGFKAFAETMDKKIAGDIANHKQNCILSRSVNSGSFIGTLKDWKTIAATILAIAWLLSSAISAFTGKTTITSEQARIIAQQVENYLLFEPNSMIK
jgi:hypothetical protein